MSNLLVDRRRMMCFADIDPRRIIYYTTTDGQPIANGNYVENNTLLSNTYDQTNGGKLLYKYNVSAFVSSAFSGNTKLSSISVPSSVTSIAYRAFFRCSNLSHIELPDSVTIIGELAFENCSNLILDILPSSLQYIDRAAFRYCPKMTFSTLPQGIIRVDEQGFRGCTNITISELPASLESIGLYGFHSCTKMNNVKVLRTSGIVTGGNDMFYGISGFKAQVPNSLLSAYQADSNWNKYTLIGYDPA